MCHNWSQDYYLWLILLSVHSPSPPAWCSPWLTLLLQAVRELKKWRRRKCVSLASLDWSTWEILVLWTVWSSPSPTHGSSGIISMVSGILIDENCISFIWLCVLPRCCGVCCFQTVGLSPRLTVIIHWAPVDGWPLALLFCFERCGRALTTRFNPPN